MVTRRRPSWLKRKWQGELIASYNWGYRCALCRKEILQGDRYYIWVRKYHRVCVSCMKEWGLIW